jgi:hypothetical protein
MKKLFWLLLLPTLLLSQVEEKSGTNVTMRREETVKGGHPKGMVKRINLLTPTITVYQDSTHFARKEHNKGPFAAEINPSPVRWDDNGTLRDYDFSERQAVNEGYKRVCVGPSAYEFNEKGEICYAKGGLAFCVRPLFEGVKSEFIFSTQGLKATYRLERPDTLAWDIVDPHGIAWRKIEKFTAFDADGNPVELVEMRKNGRLSVFIEDPKAIAAWPVIVDPTIYDTTLSVFYARLIQYYGPTFNANRDSVNATLVGSSWKATPGIYNDKYVNRSFITLALGSLSVTKVDSVRLFLRLGINAFVSDTTSIYAYWGQWKGDGQSVANYSKFQGWVAGSAFTGENVFQAALHVNPAVDTNSWVSVRLSSAACDTIFNKFSASDDTIRLMFVVRPDKDRVQPPSAQMPVIDATAGNLPYLVTYYDGEPVEGWATKVNGIVPSKVNGIAPSKVLGIQ